MSGHGRGGNDRPRSGGSSNRRQSSQSSQQRRQTTGYQAPNPPPETPPGPGYPSHYPLANVQYPPPRSGFSGQYIMSPQPPLNMAHTPPNVFPYPPSFHVQEQPQSIHAGYPTIASYGQYPPDTYSPSQSPGSPSLQQPSPVFPQSFSYPSQAYPTYAQQSTSFSPPALYQHQHQHQQHPVYPTAGSYAQYPQHHSPGATQDGVEGGGTWWYVPSPAARPTPPYSYYPQAHSQPQPEASGSGGPPMSPMYDGGGGGGAPSTPSSPSALSPVHLGRDRPIVRRAYHPNPPPTRSDWVMWAGNVPSDAVHDELWRFFTQPDDGGSTAGGSSSAHSSNSSGESVAADGGERGRNGVLSIFLISRSSCAFVNYETESDLQAAIARFNGVPLRPDPRCARLVCRVRRKDDDLRAGVGGQRGNGMHARWVKAKQKANAAAADDSGSSVTDPSEPGSPSSGSLEAPLSALSLGSDEGGPPSRPPPRPHAAGSNSSSSYASTNSSLLRQHFPQRYFILKSLTRDDLDLSVQTGLWATQKHNEGILDRAFRTSKDVFLVFSVNKSGEFYGYARMAGSIGQGEGARVTWARRDSTASSASGHSGSAVPSSTQSVPPYVAGGPTAPDSDSLHPSPQILSASRHVANSPQLFAGSSSPLHPEVKGREGHAQSAPAVLGKPHRNISISSAFNNNPSASMDRAQGISERRDVVLDAEAPYRAMRSPPGTGEAGGADAQGQRSGERRDSVSAGGGPAVSGLGSVAEEGGDRDEGTGPVGVGVGARTGNEDREEGWGENFQLQWLCTDRLPFLRTRQLRNPWNHDREIKVSRDGTELEPSVGQALLEEWQTYLAETAAGAQTPMSETGSGAGASASSSARGRGGGASSSRS
ncbi:YT521-B-like domain-containing protein [Mycena galopus ATCC 62051]|nr:YT521-B-like domain-containing protein [Mycena galopus ATCC 62051]